MMRLRNKRAVSPVIATVILVAIAITIAVAVAFWIGGITSQYTRFEKLEISSAYCETNATGDWQITMDARDTGTTDATIINVFVNSKKAEDYLGSPYNIRVFNGSWTQIDFAGNGTSLPNKITIVAGQSSKIIVLIDQTPDPVTYSFSSGTTVEVSLHSAAGNNYMKMVTLT